MKKIRILYDAQKIDFAVGIVYGSKRSVVLEDLRSYGKVKLVTPEEFPVKSAGKSHIIIAFVFLLQDLREFAFSVAQKHEVIFPDFCYILKPRRIVDSKEDEACRIVLRKFDDKLFSGCKEGVQGLFSHYKGGVPPR